MWRSTAISLTSGLVTTAVSLVVRGVFLSRLFPAFAMLRHAAHAVASTSQAACARPSANKVAPSAWAAIAWYESAASSARRTRSSIIVSIRYRSLAVAAS